MACENQTDGSKEPDTHLITPMTIVHKAQLLGYAHDSSVSKHYIRRTSQQDLHYDSSKRLSVISTAKEVLVMSFTRFIYISVRLSSGLVT